MKKTLLLILLLVTTFTSCSKKNELNLAITKEITSLDPAIVYNENAIFVIQQSLEQLYQYHYLQRPYKIIPLLAQGEPLYSEDRKTINVKIKKGIFYSNNSKYFLEKREVKARDFVNQFKRIAFKPTNSPGKWMFSGTIKGFDKFSDLVGSDVQKMINTEIEGIKAVGDYELQFTLNKPTSDFIHFLTMSFISPVPLEVIKKEHNNLSEVVIGTGPYKTEIISKNKITLVKNELYHGDSYPSVGDLESHQANLLVDANKALPFIDKINIKLITKEKELWNAFWNKEIDILEVPRSYLPNVSFGEDFKKLQKKHNISFKQYPLMSMKWLGINMKDPLLGKNLNLRKAIAYGIDYDKYIEVISKNINLKSNTIFHPGINGFNPSRKNVYEHDLKKAKEFLAKADIAPGTTLKYSTRGTEEINHVEANFFKDQFKNIGINLEIEVLSFKDFIKKGRSNKLQIFTDGWIYDYPAANNIVQLLHSNNSPGINKSGYQNKKLDELINQMNNYRYAKGPIMNDIENIIEQDLPWIKLMYENVFILSHKHIKNYRRSAFSRNYLKYLKID